MQKWVVVGGVSLYLIAWGVLGVTLWMQRPIEYAPMRYENPASVTPMEISSSHLVISVQTVKCSTASQPIAVEGSYSARNLDTGQLVAQLYPSNPPQSVLTGVWDPGCHQLGPITLTLTGLSVGRWRLEGSTTTHSQHNEQQTVPWFTTDFEVTD